MSLAASVNQDGFFHDGFNLYVEVAGGTRHARFSTAQLEEIFYPNNKHSKAAAAQPVQAKTYDWYEAQLIHYGLPASKDESVCKARLLHALNNKMLEVPVPIKELEEALKNEFNVKNHKGKAEYDVASTNIKLDASGSAKRKHDSPDSATSLARTADVSLPISKKKKLASETVVAASDEVQHETDFKEDPKTANESACNSEPTGQSVVQMKSNPEVKEEPAVNTEIQAKKESPTEKSELEVSEEPGVKVENKVQKECVERASSLAQSSASPSTPFPPLGYVEGVYDIHGDMSSEATLTLTPEVHELWGEFDLGHSSGIIIFPQRPCTASDRPAVGRWYPHLRDDPQDGLNLGEAIVYFTGNGHIHGSFSSRSFPGGPITFQGSRRPGPPHTLRRPESYAEEWNLLLALDGFDVEQDDD